jgi:GH24 family phage-related lysozyme (muramidase)
MIKKLWDFFVKILIETIQEQQSQTTSVSNKKPRTYLDYDWSSVIEFETGGKNYYEKFLKQLTWPRGDSGITMGIGADLGYMSKEEFDEFFSHYFTTEQKQLIYSVIGLKGTAAKTALPKVKHIELSWQNASDAFVKWTLPKFWKMANTIWPGLDQLNEKTQVALVSIVFNRGASLNGATRAEMKNIAPLVINKDYKKIAEQIRSMKRLWIGKNLDGLLTRREKEAKMVEEGLA